MDSDVLRGILAIMGIALVMGIYLWDRFRHRKVRSQSQSQNPARRRDDKDPTAANLTNSSNDRVEQLNLDSFGPATESVEVPLGEDPLIPGSAKERGGPELIQFAIIAQGNHFGGTQLFKVFADLNMRYGPMNIFHYYHEGSDNIEFSAATMVEPGSFPIKEIASFETPGLALFFQPSQVSKPIDCFDNMVSACRELARRLNGKILDGDKEPLTDETVMKIRNNLQ